MYWKESFRIYCFRQISIYCALLAIVSLICVYSYRYVGDVKFSIKGVKVDIQKIDTKSIRKFDLEYLTYSIMDNYYPDFDYNYVTNEILAMKERVSTNAKNCKNLTIENYVGILSRNIHKNQSIRIIRSRDEYYSPSFQYLLDKKVGHCLSLSFLYKFISVYEYQIDLLTVPSHVLIQVSDKDQKFYIETTQSGKIYKTLEYLNNHLGQDKLKCQGSFDLRALESEEIVALLIYSIVLDKKVTIPYEEQERLLKKAVELCPHFYLGYYKLASIYYQSNTMDFAIFYFEKAIEANSKYSDAYSYLIHSLLARKDLPSIKFYLDKWERECGSSSTYLEYYALYHMLQGEVDLAKRIWTKELDEHQLSLEAYLNLTDVLMRSGDVKLLKHYLPVARSLYPQNKDLLEMEKLIK